MRPIDTYYNHFSRILKEELKKPLPGIEVQRKMLPVNRLKDKFEIPGHKKDGAVLILLYLKDNEIYTCFIKRSEDGSVHSGQISFPGGKKEKHDKDLIYTALRESQEEIGIHLSGINVLGTLSNLYIPVSNYSVYPVIGQIDTHPDFKINTYEVQELIEVPLKKLTGPSICTIGKVQVNNSAYDVPVYDLGRHKIWGATAMIISEFLHVVRHACETNGFEL